MNNLNNQYISTRYSNKAIKFWMASLVIALLFLINITNAYAADLSPVITVQPQDQSVTEGQPVTFSVTAEAVMYMFYQWYRVGTDGRGDVAVGTNSPTYTIREVTVEQNSGQQYYVVITSFGVSTRSRTATLTVNSGFAITQQPQDATMITGSTASFSVAASGDSPYTYQWYADMNTGRWQTVGTNASSYSTTVTADKDGWQFYVTVTGNSGTTLTSNTATLRILSQLAFVTHPQNTSASAGETATFTALAAGQERISYQWFVDTGDGRWYEVTSAGAYTSYTTPALTMAYNGYHYMCRAYGDDGRFLDSNTAALTVTQPPLSITQQPQDATMITGSTASFSVVASGDSPYTYQWYADMNTGRWQTVGTNASSYSTTVTADKDGWQFYVKVTGNSGTTLTSNTATLRIMSQLAFVTHPQNASAYAGETATFTALAAGQERISYQWFVDTGDGRWYEVTSAGAYTSYTTPALTSGHNGYHYMCRAYGDNGQFLDSNTAALTVTQLPPLSITSNPADARVYAGQTATFSITADSTAPLTYHWYVDTGEGFPREFGVNAPSYTTGVLDSSSDGYTYYCVVADSYSQSKTSTAATLRVLTPLAITKQPQDDIIIQPTASALFSLSATGELPITYQWYLSRNGGAAWETVGTNAPTLTLSNEPALSGNVVVYCHMEDAYGSVLDSHTAAIRYIPTTGDDSNPLLWTIAFILSAGMLAAVLTGIIRHRHTASK